MIEHHPRQPRSLRATTSTLAISAGLVSVALTVVLALVQIDSGSFIVLSDRVQTIAASAAVLSIVLTILGAMTARRLAKRRAEASRQEVALMHLFLEDWAAFEQTLRAHLRDKGGKELPLRELFHRASEILEDDRTEDTMFSLLALRNSIVHKGERLGIEELEVAVSALGAISTQLNDQLGVSLASNGVKRERESAGRFEVFRDDEGDYRWRLTRGRGAVIFVSEGHKTFAASIADINHMRDLIKNAEVETAIDQS